MTANMNIAGGKPRIEWVDFAKGISIIMVVMLHVSLGVQRVLGDCTWFAYIVEWARPFRIPAFFLLSGLFLSRRVNWPWRRFIDRRVVHFAWFYVLWLVISFIYKGPMFVREFGVDGTLKMFALSFIDPFGTLWFIYLLAIFAVVTKLLKDVPAWIVWPAAALLEAAHIHTGWMVPDEFASRFVHFYTGVIAAPHVFRFADALKRLSLPALFAALLIWAFIEAGFVFQDMARLPGISLMLGIVGSLAVVGAGVWLHRAATTWPWARWLDAFRHLGQNTLTVYVAFVVFMGAARTVLVKLVPGLGPDLISVLVLMAAITGPLVLQALVKGTALRYLFERPAWFSILPRRPGPRMQPAE